VSGTAANNNGVKSAAISSSTPMKTACSWVSPVRDDDQGVPAALVPAELQSGEYHGRDASRYQNPKGSCAPYSRSLQRRAQSEELDDATYIDVISARVTCASITAILRMIETARKEVRAGKTIY
jgi:hypothetical protein